MISTPAPAVASAASLVLLGSWLGGGCVNNGNCAAACGDRAVTFVFAEHRDQLPLQVTVASGGRLVTILCQEGETATKCLSSDETTFAELDAAGALAAVVWMEPPTGTFVLTTSIASMPSEVHEFAAPPEIYRVCGNTCLQSQTFVVR